MKSWIVECAELFVRTKNNFRDILPTHDIEASKYQIQKFFDCVAATMSRQLRQIVFKSLKHFMGKILEYKVCGLFKNVIYVILQNIIIINCVVIKLGKQTMK